MKLRSRPHRAEFKSLFARHCALLAPNLSWATVERAPGQFRFQRQQYALDFAREHHLRLTGAHLLWHERTPACFAAAPDREHARQLVVDHINFMCKKFAGQIWSWNVVNEALNPKEGRPDGLRKSPLLDQLGTDFFDIGFHTARQADPEAILVYNDYDMSTTRRNQRLGGVLLCNFSIPFSHGKIPIDAVGLQTHIKLARFPLLSADLPAVPKGDRRSRRADSDYRTGCPGRRRAFRYPGARPGCGGRVPAGPGSRAR